MGDDGVVLCDPYSSTHCSKYWNVDKPSKNTVKTKVYREKSKYNRIVTNIRSSLVKGK